MSLSTLFIVISAGFLRFGTNVRMGGVSGEGVDARGNVGAARIHSMFNPDLP